MDFYKDGNIVESISYDENGEIITKGTYKDGAKFNGQFYRNHNHSITFYKDGKEQEYIEYENEERKKVIYRRKKIKGTDNTLVSTIHTHKDETYECIYKDKEPFEGQFFEFSNLSTYQNGERIASINYVKNTAEIESKR